MSEPEAVQETFISHLVELRTRLVRAIVAVLVGRRTAEQAGHYQGNHHGVPIVVVSHRPPLPRWPAIRR